MHMYMYVYVWSAFFVLYSDAYHSCACIRSHNQGMCVVCGAVLWLHIFLVLREGLRGRMVVYGAGGGESTIGAEGGTERKKEGERGGGKREKERD